MSLFFRKAEPIIEQRSEWIDFSDRSAETRAISRATRLGPVFAAIRHITDYVASLPVDCYLERSDGERRQIPLPAVLRKLDDPRSIGLRTWFGQAAYALAVDGNAVGYRPEPDTIIWLSRCDWSFDEATQQWSVRGHDVPREQIVHIPWIVPAGCTLGLSPIEHYAAIVAAGLSAQEYADMKRGGGLPPSSLKNMSQTVDPKQAEVIEERLSSRFAKGRPFVHGKDWEFKPISIPPNHAQFIETLKLTANQIAAIYGIDPTEIGGEAANNQEYSNEEMRQIKRAANMRPYLVRLEQGISRVLSPRTSISFNIDATLRSDAQTRSDVLGKEIADGRLSVNEARAIEKRKPVPGGDHHNITGATPPLSL